MRLKCAARIRLRPALLAAGALLLLLVSGCIPVAWVTPPLALEASAGAMMRGKSAHHGKEFGGAFPVSASFMPLQLSPAMLTRSLDLGAGYHLLPATNQRLKHGPHLDLAWLHAVGRPEFLDWAFDDQDRARLGLRLRGQVFWGPMDGELGRGAALQVSFEGFRFRANEFGGCALNTADNSPGGTFGGGRDPDQSAFCGTGYAWGESSFGVFAETSYARIDHNEQWLLSIGLKWRAPATVGAGFIAGNF